MVPMVVSLFDPLTNEARLVELPGRWVICERCDGDGTHSGGIVLTGSYLDESYGDDWNARDDLVRSMRRGWYRCDDCDGTGKRLTYADGGEHYTDEQRRLVMLHMEQEAERRAEQYADEQMRRAESGYAW